MKCKIADFNVEITSEVETEYRKLNKYAADFDKADIKIHFDEDDLKREIPATEETLRPWVYKYSTIYRKLGEVLPMHDAFVLHSATFDVQGTGVAFAARSGTGKSTHMLLWQKLLGDKMVVVNGDKPIVRFIEDKPYAYGTPWNGKESLGCNMRTPLQNICFIERAMENSVEKIDKSEAVEVVLKQIYIPKNPVSMMKTLELANKLVSSCDFWRIKCNMEPDAAKVAYNTIFKK